LGCIAERRGRVQRDAHHQQRDPPMIISIATKVPITQSAVAGQCTATSVAKMRSMMPAASVRPQARPAQRGHRAQAQQSDREKEERRRQRQR